MPTPLEPEQHRGRSRFDAAVQPLAAGARQSADDVNRHTGRDRFDLLHKRPRIIDPVGLGQHDLRRSAALPDRDETPLDPLEVDLRAERVDEEREVDVRDQRLRTRRAAGRTANEGRAPRQHRADRPVGEAHPVADGDIDSREARPPGRARAHDAGGRVEVERAPVNGHHAGRLEITLQIATPAGAPAEHAQVKRAQRRSPPRPRGLEACLEIVPRNDDSRRRTKIACVSVRVSTR